MLTPGYGETPVSDEELDSLLPSVRDLLETPVIKAVVYDLEQAVQAEVADELLIMVIDGALDLDELISDRFLRELHGRLYGEIWTWARTFRKREVNIGVAPEQIAVQLRGSLDSIRYRWHHERDLTARELGVAIHAETVRIHPFVDGNGRTTRLLADLVFLAAEGSDDVQIYDWVLDKRRYIELLRRYDQHRDPRELAAFIQTKPLGD